uniref:Uncharacterized protein n=1 Tax=Romanomermis culicivorax TaxID=13658 RepID=A0A915INL7_ROMCU
MFDAVFLNKSECNIWHMTHWAPNQESEMGAKRENGGLGSDVTLTGAVWQLDRAMIAGAAALPRVHCVPLRSLTLIDWRYGGGLSAEEADAVDRVVMLKK